MVIKKKIELILEWLEHRYSKRNMKRRLVLYFVGVIFTQVLAILVWNWNALLYNLLSILGFLILLPIVLEIVVMEYRKSKSSS
ncbi:hypothetical protein [Lactococcus allomyrinae]|uniref:Uncharacterized protein n=1 Tax=Lactococcus allomyrinae TaxID=2419773 RepID=A0A387BIF1_9LACT|nr:hypothetical protein [Lactococcus allomyrinae]AYG01139.1 hypothetical protein D7I46_08550 [Lactococcus allomyrinae]